MHQESTPQATSGGCYGACCHWELGWGRLIHTVSGWLKVGGCCPVPGCCSRVWAPNPLTHMTRRAWGCANGPTV